MKIEEFIEKCQSLNLEITEKKLNQLEIYAKFLQEYNIAGIEGIDTRFKSAVSNTKLPEKPNFNEVEKWVMSVYKRYLV